MLGKYKIEKKKNMFEFKLYFTKIKPEAFYKPEIEKNKIKIMHFLYISENNLQEKKSCSITFIRKTVISIFLG